MSGHRGGDLPQEDLAAQVVGVVQVQAHQRVTRRLQGCQRRIVRLVALKPQMNEQPVAAVDLRRTQRFPYHRQ